MNFTFAYLSYKNEVYEMYLKPCLQKIENQVEIITKKDMKSSTFFNLVQREAKNKFVIFSHEDITFSSDLLQQIEVSISRNPNFGVLCAVGKNKENKNIGSLVSSQRTLEFCDPCFFVINRDNNFLFDEVIFDDFHFTIEDYCVGIKQKMDKDTITLCLNWGKNNIDDQGVEIKSSIKHHSYTSRTTKYQWGNYSEYKKRFKNKWGVLQNIKNF